MCQRPGRLGPLRSALFFGLVSAHYLGDVGSIVFECHTGRRRCRSGAKKGAAESGRREQFGLFQSPPRTAVRLSCAEIRRLFWQLVLLVERSTEAILRWSTWRRWHQAWARYYHYRRRARAEEGNERPEPGAEPAAASQLDVTEVVWSRLERLLGSAQGLGRPIEHSRRVVFEAIVHVKQTDCGWRNLPSHYPAWQTVYAQLRQWRKTGIWDKIWSGLDQSHPTG